MVLLWLFLRFFERRNLYYPERVLDATPADARLPFEDVTFVAEDDCPLHGWWIPHQEARGTIIMCHGNAGNISSRIWMAADLYQLGVNVFLFDYRGYGKSRGIPSERGLARDARAAFEMVRARYKDSEEPPVIVYGRSLGGAVAVQLALDKPVRGLILESALASTIEIGKELYPLLPVSLFCRDRYDMISKIKDVTVPLVIAHSPHDTLIPYKLGQKVFENAHEPKVFHDLHGDHNDSGWNFDGPYWHSIEELADQVFGPRKNTL